MTTLRILAECTEWESVLEEHCRSLIAEGLLDHAWRLVADAAPRSTVSGGGHGSLIIFVKNNADSIVFHGIVIQVDSLA